MKREQTQIHIHGSGSGKAVECRSAASLHCHTHFSKEILTFIPYYASRVPILSGYFSAALEKYRSTHGVELDFSKAYWTPPVTPRQVIDVETLQIEKELGLPALVSITDHDDIEAGLLLQVLGTPDQYPISMEWTVPFGGGYFHLGVHNLQRENAVELATAMQKFTNGSADSPSLDELLGVLNESPSTLIVLNHPFWDLELIGGEHHRNCLRAFIARHGDKLHALEINGFRTWKENRETMMLANELGLPLVSGGDRHGCQPNSIINLTRARSFDDMVGEIREDRHSDILILPGYREPMVTRVLESVAEVIGNHPGHALGHSHWSDRIHFNFNGADASESQPLSTHWPDGGPGWVRLSLWLLRRLGSKELKSALRLALGSERVNFEYES